MREDGQRIDFAMTASPVIDEAGRFHGISSILRDITELFANARVIVLAIKTQSNKKSHTATMRVRVEVPNLGSLSKLLERINRLKNVISAVRVSE